MSKARGVKTATLSLASQLLDERREYWRMYSPHQWLFPGQKPDSHITCSSVHPLFMQQKKADITKECSLHTLRLSFATHLLYHGYDLYTISELLGHASIRSTIIYLHIVPARYSEQKSPLDFLETEKEGSSDDKK